VLGPLVEVMTVINYISMKLFVERSKRDIVAHNRETKRYSFGV
jgi:hypothetical protein